MAIFQRGMWFCGYCGKQYKDQTKADLCRESHELIYIPLSLGDLNMLVNFIHTKNDDYISTTILDTLHRYLRSNIK